MLFHNMSREEIQSIIVQLEQALYNYQQWYNLLIRTLVCRLPGDQHDMSADAYKECRFGQWYYSSAPEKLLEHPGFIAIGEEHKRMHQLATSLLHENNMNAELVYDYDKFANAIERMRLEIATLKRELEDSLYNHDPLTGAMTRVHMLPLLREQQELVKRESQPCCIAMVDIDLFKGINDRYGHNAGDRVLTTLISYITEHLRPYDKVFRYGGEEFLLCVQNIDIPRGFPIIEHLCKEIVTMDMDIGNAKPIHLSISVGLTTLDPNVPVEESIERADKAMYSAKAAGRNCVHVWDSTMK